MKIHTTNYFDTFIAVAEDSKAVSGTVPPIKPSGLSVANLQFELLFKHPYQYTSDDLLFQVYATRNDLPTSELEPAKAAFFAKGQACMRASPLCKTYGWGIHFNEEGKMALYGNDTDAYKEFKNDELLKQVKAMRSKRI